MRLTRIFVDSLNRGGFKPSTSKRFKIKPSMLGSPCLRKIFYSATRVPEDFDFPISGKKRMKLGEAIHHMLETVFKKEGILVQYYNPDGSIPKDFNGEDNREFPVQSPELFIALGKIDAVFIIDGKLWLGEYKSINTNGFNSLMKPKDDHLVQGVTYFYIFNQHLKDGKYSHIKELAGFEKAEGVIFLYIHKDDTEFKEFEYTQADTVFKSIVQKIFTIKQFADRKELPPKTPDFCSSCGWRTKCKKNQIE